MLIEWNSINNFLTVSHAFQCILDLGSMTVLSQSNTDHVQDVIICIETLGKLIENIGYSRKRDCIFHPPRYKISYVDLSFFTQVREITMISLL